MNTEAKALIHDLRDNCRPRGMDLVQGEIARGPEENGSRLFHSSLQAKSACNSMTIMRIVQGVFAVASALTMTACGGDSRTSPTPNPGGSTGGATITITSSGVSRQNVTVVRGAQVTFVNNDSRPHEIRSDPHPSHGDCPEINQVGLVQPGNNRQTGNLTTVRTCAFHDDSDTSNSSLQGTIQIQ